MAGAQQQVNQPASNGAVVSVNESDKLDLTNPKIPASAIKEIQTAERSQINADPKLTDCERADKQIEVSNKWKAIWEKRMANGDKNAGTYLKQTESFISGQKRLKLTDRFEKCARP